MNNIEMKKAELIGSWLFKFNDEEKGSKRLKRAEELCVLNGIMNPGEFTTF